MTRVGVSYDEYVQITFNKDAASVCQSPVYLTLEWIEHAAPLVVDKNLDVHFGFFLEVMYFKLKPLFKSGQEFFGLLDALRLHM